MQPGRPVAGPPFCADHVGSLLRPPTLLDARARAAAREIDADELCGVEDEAIADVVRLQGDVGLRTATDGEVRRASWPTDSVHAVDGPLSIDEPISGRDPAEALFGGPEVDGFVLEYDDVRSGGSEPLRFVPPGRRVVLGLVTTKRPELGSEDDLDRRIDEAARHVPLERLAISPQCGSSSTVEGKPALVVEVAQEVWGYARKGA